MTSSRKSLQIARIHLTLGSASASVYPLLYSGRIPETLLESGRFQ